MRRQGPIHHERAVASLTDHRGRLSGLSPELELALLATHRAGEAGAAGWVEEQYHFLAHMKRWAVRQRLNTGETLPAVVTQRPAGELHEGECLGRLTFQHLVHLHSDVQDA